MKLNMKFYKAFKNLLLAFAATVILVTTVNLESTQAQELSPGVDLYSTYVWRGVAFSGPSVQPYVDFTAGNFTLGAWGSQGIDGSVADGTNGFQEMDLYAAYSFDFGLSLGVTDYYFPGSEYFDGESHAFELNGGFSSGDFSVSANVILNEADFAGSAGGDLYFELGYGPVFIGGGDGWHTSDGDFDIVNIGVTKSKEIKVTDSFTIPLTGSAIWNPHTEQFYILAGISL